MPILEKDPPPPPKSTWYSAAQASSIGFEILLSLGVGYFIGYKLDGWLSTTPWFTVIFFLAGVGSAVKAMMRIVRQYKKENPDESDGGDRN